jgi:hypothetical protein
MSASRSTSSRSSPHHGRPHRRLPAPPHPLPLPKRLHHHQAFMATSTARASPSYRAPSPAPPHGIKGGAEPLPPRTSLLRSSLRTAQPPPEAQSTIRALSAARGGPSHPLSHHCSFNSSLLRLSSPPVRTPLQSPRLHLSIFYLTFILLPPEGHRFGTARNSVRCHGIQ